jgi:hypothetical protein
MTLAQIVTLLDENEKFEKQQERAARSKAR